MSSKSDIIVEDIGIASIELSMAVLDEIAGTIPGFSFAWKSVNAISQAQLKLRIKRAAEFVEHIKSNPEIFCKQVIETESFQDGCVVAFEKFLLERNAVKRVMLKNIFSGFASSHDLENFNLERLYSIVSNLSQNSLKYVQFISTTIIPLMEESFDRESVNSASEVSDATWWMRHLKDTEPLSKYIEKFIFDNYDPNSKFVKNKYNYSSEKDSNNVLLQKIFDLQSVETKKAHEAMAELVSAGLCRGEVSGGGGLGGGGGTLEFILTDFGWEFLDFVNTDLTGGEALAGGKTVQVRSA